MTIEYNNTPVTCAPHACGSESDQQHLWCSHDDDIPLLAHALSDIDFDSLSFHLNSSSKIATARMFCLGVNVPPPLTPLSLAETEAMQVILNSNATNVVEHFPPNHMVIQGGLASRLVHLLQLSLDQWKTHLPDFCTPKHDPTQLPINNKTVITNALNVMNNVLTLLLQVCKLDTTLTEEMAKGCGMHTLLSTILRMDVYKILDGLYPPPSTTTTTTTASREEYEMTEDALIEIQDLAAQLAHVDSALGYPVKVTPYSMEELHARLPLVFSIVSPSGRNKECFMVHQVTERQSAQEDVGFVMWPSAVVLASWLLDQEDLVRGSKQVLELGAGCGLTGMVAARIAAGSKGNQDSASSTSTQVILTDFHPKVLKNIHRNISLNGLDPVAKVMHLDFYSHCGLEQCDDGAWRGRELSVLLQDHQVCHIMDPPSQPPVDLILAADTICKASDSVAVSDTIYHALVPGGEAIVVSADAQHRFGVDIFEKECQRNGLQVTTFNVADLCQGKLVPGAKDDDPCGIRQTSGYVDGMSLTMFRILKPL